MIASASGVRLDFRKQVVGDVGLVDDRAVDIAENCAFLLGYDERVGDKLDTFDEGFVGSGFFWGEGFVFDEGELGGGL